MALWVKLQGAKEGCKPAPSSSSSTSQPRSVLAHANVVERMRRTLGAVEAAVVVVVVVVQSRWWR